MATLEVLITYNTKKGASILRAQKRYESVESPLKCTTRARYLWNATHHLQTTASNWHHECNQRWEEDPICHSPQPNMCGSSKGRRGGKRRANIPSQSEPDVSDSSSSPNKSKSRAITGVSRYLWRRKTAAITGYQSCIISEGCCQQTVSSHL